MFICANNSIYNFNDIPILTGLSLSNLTYLSIILATTSIINSNNMMNGVDSLAASVLLVAFTDILIFHGDINNNERSLILCIIAFSAIFVRFNLNFWRIPRGKLFLSDAGNISLNLLLISFMETKIQGENARFKSITPVWITASPLLDSINIIDRRIQKTPSSLKLDKELLPSLFIKTNFNTIQALAGINTMTVIVCITNELAYSPKHILLTIFLALYCHLIIHRLYP